MLSDVMLYVFMLSVVAPFTQFGKNSLNAGYVQSIRDVSNDVLIWRIFNSNFVSLLSQVLTQGRLTEGEGYLINCWQ
jgi:hypothetical protein